MTEKSIQRYALTVEYDGTHFKGWQKQESPPVRSVEEVLTAALTKVANEPILPIAAGRTDAGVHANNLIVHFDTYAERTPYSWLLGLNSNLPDDCAVKQIVPVSLEFHARHSAIARHYRYRIHNSPYRSALSRTYASWIRYPLDSDAMQRAAQALIGEHDFSAFRSSECQSHSTMRSVYEIKITHRGTDLYFDLKANAFLHHMARNIVGTLLEVGRGRQPVEYTKEVLLSRDRRLGGINAPPQGLYLEEVIYPNGLLPK